MIRNKRKDAETLANLLTALERFDEHKMKKWEQIDEEVQASNLPGTPTEDWIIPPDEDITSERLMKDGSYRKLREQIERFKIDTIEIASFLKTQVHPIEWLSFTNPLIGNEALEDAKASLKLLIAKQKKTFYFWENLKKIATPKY